MKKIFATSLLIYFLAVFPALSFVPTDPLYHQQQHLQQINMEEAWEVARGQGVVVAVLDSGVDIDHPDLKENIWINSDEVAGDGLDNDNNGYIDDVYGWDFVTNTNNPKPKFDGDYNKFGLHHGTAVAGMIGAVTSNGMGLAGIAFQAKIMPLRILDGEGVGEVSNLIKAIEYAVNNGADIINLSLVGDTYSGQLKDAIEWASSKGVLVVAASGNSDDEGQAINLDLTPTYPACFGDNTDNNWVLAVSAVNEKDVKASFASYGKHCIDVVAPGTNLISLGYHDPSSKDYQDLYSYNWHGTSLSSAIVSGVAAVIKSYDYLLTPQQIISVLRDSAVSIDQLNPSYSGRLGAGRIDAGSALTAAKDLSRGVLVKLSDYNAVYYVKSNTRHLFSNEVTFWTWYSGGWGDQDVVIISQSEFDNLQVGENITARPGVNLIRFENSSRVYSVMPNKTLCRLKDDNSATSLYGVSWQDDLILIQNAFEANYIKDSSCILESFSAYPDGSLISYRDTNDIWYIVNNLKRRVSSHGFTLNGFKSSAIINDVSPSMQYVTGEPIISLEKDVYIYHK